MLVDLTKGRQARIDRKDWPIVKKFKWCTTINGTQAYAKAYAGGGRKNPQFVYLHHVIVGKPKKGLVVDHVNGDGLDNRRKNLRIIPWRLNTLGKKVLRSNNTSGYTGVSWVSRSKKWKAQIRSLGRMMTLGEFKDKMMAVKAYQAAAKKEFGIYAKL